MGSESSVSKNANGGVILNKVVFLDRDGTIAKDVHYCRRAEDFEFLPTVTEAVKLLNEIGFKVVVVTNQSGIARGYFSEETLAQIHAKMKEEFAQHGAYIDAVYYCPHHPDDGCDCRKPRTALFRSAARDMGIDFKTSYVIGDSQIDVDAGKILGCKTILVTTVSQGRRSDSESPDYAARSLLEAVQWIIKDVK